eukprot:8049810-Lingulodinium_polyedra.AAC.1
MDVVVHVGVLLGVAGANRAQVPGAIRLEKGEDPPRASLTPGPQPSAAKRCPSPVLHGSVEAPL